MIDSMKVLKDLEFTRTWGSEEEKKAAKIIQSVLDSIGVKNKLETFKLNDAEIQEVSLEVTKPYAKKYDCLGYKLAGNAKNLTKKAVFVKDVTQIDKYDLKDKIALIQGRVGYWVYKDLVEAGCVGIVIGDGYLFVEDNDIDFREMREPLHEFGKLPVVECNIKDLYEMVQDNAAEIRMTTVQKEFTCTSQNVVAKIAGSSDRSIVLTAHYDSTFLSKGSWDNASGSVGLIKIAEYFAANKPYHNLIFVWCGAEERGLDGSKAYVKKHAKELKDIDLCINLDMIGSTFGKLLACVTGEEKMVSYLEYFSSEQGKACHCYQDVYSSDSTPFADNGVPAISFGQSSTATPIHCRFDTMYLMHRETMEDDVNFIIAFAARMANAKKVPISREMPENMKDKLDIYLLRKRK